MSLENPAISGTEAEKNDGDFLLSEYMASRRIAISSRINESDFDLISIQKAVGLWIEENFDITSVNYDECDENAVENKILGVMSYIVSTFPGIVSDEEIRATKLFIRASFKVYYEYLELSKYDNNSNTAKERTFAFIVPSRTSRLRKDYGIETEMVCPITRYVPNEYRGFLGVGLPPFVVDIYNQENDNSNGVLINASIFPDSIIDLPLTDAHSIAQKNVDSAVDFARVRFGTNIAGLGAIIPAITKFGTTINNQEVVTTTGHAGTVAMIELIIRQLTQHEESEIITAPTIGFLGLGSIGHSAAAIIANNFPESSIRVFDLKSTRTSRTRQKIESLGIECNISENVYDLIQGSHIIVSAITGSINLDDIDPDSKLDLSKKLILDDSQPGSFDRTQVESRGGRLVWVIAHDSDKIAERSGYDYGTLFDPKYDLFGCEAEAATLSKYYSDLLHRVGNLAARRIVERVALREPVTERKAKLFKILFNRYGIIPAKLQVRGELIE